MGLLLYLASSLLSPHLFLVLSLVSVYLVCVFPALLVRSLPLSTSAPAHVPCLFLVTLQYVLVLSFPCLICPFPFLLHLLNCLLLLPYLAVFFSYFVFRPLFCLLLVPGSFGFCIVQLENKAHFLFPPYPCPMSNCIWVQLLSPKPFFCFSPLTLRDRCFR